MKKRYEWTKTDRAHRWKWRFRDMGKGLMEPGKKERREAGLVVVTTLTSSSSKYGSNQSHRSAGGCVYLIYINPRPRIYGESL